MQVRACEESFIAVYFERADAWTAGARTRHDADGKGTGDKRGVELDICHGQARFDVFKHVRKDKPAVFGKDNGKTTTLYSFAAETCSFLQYIEVT
jgi:hypothetical protein